LMLGCVTGDDSNGNAPGTLGGPCFANNTCNTGLVCALENGSGVCEQPDGTSPDAPTDGPTSSDASQDQTAADAPADGTSDAPSDAGSDACDAESNAPPICAGCTTGEKCCPMTRTCYSSGCGTQCSDVCWCSNVSSCGGTSFCCLPVTPSNGCPLTVSASGTISTSCVASASDCANGVFLCETDSDCPSNVHTCTGVAVQGLGTTVQDMRICQ